MYKGTPIGSLFKKSEQRPTHANTPLAPTMIPVSPPLPAPTNPQSPAIPLKTPPSMQVSKLPVSESEAFENRVYLSSHHKKTDKESLLKITFPRDQGSLYFPVSFIDGIDETKIGISNLLRKVYSLSFSDFVGIDFELKNEQAPCIRSLSFEIIGCPKKSSVTKKIKTTALASIIHDQLKHYPITLGQVLYIPYCDKDINLYLEIQVTSIDGHLFDKTSDFSVQYRLDESSELNFNLSPAIKYISLIETKNPMQSLSLNFAVKGVGGHKKQLESLVRDIFYSRAMPPEYAEEYGVNPTKGILLYGPPGTGKTLIGRVIGSMLTKEEKIKVINGPELKNKYVGQGAQNLRDVFTAADEEWAAQGSESDTYVFIFDEIDALCPERGSRSGGTGSDEDMVSTLLTKLDGVKSQHNFVIIGTTNRRDLIDPALLRPGRLECHLEIGLPDEKDRLEILSIKIDKMKTHELLDDSVQLDHWAKQTKNYTGAELEELVKKSVHYAMGANFELDPESGALAFSKDIKDKNQLQKVTQEHFVRSFSEILPAFGTDKQFGQFKKDRFIVYNDTMKEIEAKFQAATQLLTSRRDLTTYQLLIHGFSGSGKTNLAMYLANQSHAKYIKVITAEKLLSLPLPKQLDYLDEQFDNAKRVEFSILILDDLENLFGADAEMHGYNNSLRMKLLSCLKSIEQSENKCIVIATTQNLEFINRMKLMDTFNETISLPLVSLDLSSANCSQTCSMLTTICHSLGYDGIIATPPVMSRTASTQKIELSIRDLLYQIKKYHFENGIKTPMLVEQFLNFIQSPQTQRKFTSGLFYQERTLHEADQTIISDSETKFTF